VSQLLDFINSPIGGAVIALIVSAAVRALPEPQPMGNLFYLWFYNFSHTLLANFDKVGSKSHRA
jgi:hypothetical protein